MKGKDERLHACCLTVGLKDIAVVAEVENLPHLWAVFQSIDSTDEKCDLSFDTEYVNCILDEISIGLKHSTNTSLTTSYALFAAFSPPKCEREIAQQPRQPLPIKYCPTVNQNDTVNIARRPH